MALAPPPPHQRATLIPLTRPKTHEWYAPNQGVFAPGTFSKGNKLNFSRDFSSFLFGRTTFYMQKTTQNRNINSYTEKMYASTCCRFLVKLRACVDINHFHPHSFSRDSHWSAFSEFQEIFYQLQL